MLGDRGLRDTELALDHATHLAGGLFAVGEQLDDAPAYRVTQDLERVHPTIISAWPYISKR